MELANTPMSRMHRSTFESALPVNRRTRAALRRLMLVLLFLSSGWSFAAQPSFFRFDIPQIAAASIADFGSLNTPLQTGDRLKACGPVLCTVSSPTSVRLFGVNLLFGAALPDAGQAAQLARRLRALGVNLVRLHGLDALSSAGDGGPTGLLTSGPFPTLDEQAVDRLRDFLEQLRENGIYADLNLHVSYQFRPEIDHTQALPNGGPWPNQSKPLLLIDETAIALQARYAQMLLERLRGAGEPALALVEINNESSLVYHWMDGTLERLVTGRLQATLVAEWRRYCQAHGVARCAEDNGIVPFNTGDSSKAAAFLQFLSEKDKRYVDTVAAAVKHVNPDLLVLGSQMNFGSLANFRSFSAMDVLDDHFYVDQYQFPRGMWRWDNWQITDRSNIATGLVPLLGAAFYRSFDKPFLITEFNQPWPNRQSSEILPETVAFASLQDWSGLVFHDYAQTRDTYTTDSPLEFSLVGDATKLVQFGQAAWIYRTGAIARLDAVMPYGIDDALILDATRARTTDGLAALLEQHGVINASSPFSARVGYAADAPATQTTAPTTAPATEPHAHFDLRARNVVINAPGVEGVTGYLQPGRRYDYGTFQIKLDPAARGFISLTLSARDNREIRQSRSLLLTVPGYTVGSAMSSRGPVPQDLSGTSAPLDYSLKHVFEAPSPRWTLFAPATHEIISLRAIKPPVWMERVPCTLSFSSSAASLRVYPLDANGHRLAALDPRFVRKTHDGFAIDLQAPAQTPSPWFELSASD